MNALDIRSVSLKKRAASQRRGNRAVRGVLGGHREEGGDDGNRLGRAEGCEGGPTRRGATLRDARRGDAKRPVMSCHVMSCPAKRMCGKRRGGELFLPLDCEAKARLTGAFLSQTSARPEGDGRQENDTTAHLQKCASKGI